MSCMCHLNFSWKVKQRALCDLVRGGNTLIVVPSLWAVRIILPSARWRALFVPHNDDQKVSASSSIASSRGAHLSWALVLVCAPSVVDCPSIPYRPQKPYLKYLGLNRKLGTSAISLGGTLPFRVVLHAL